MNECYLIYLEEKEKNEKEWKSGTNAICAGTAENGTRPFSV